MTSTFIRYGSAAAAWAVCPGLLCTLSRTILVARRVSVVPNDLRGLSDDDCEWDVLLTLGRRWRNVASGKMLERRRGGPAGTSTGGAVGAGVTATIPADSLFPKAAGKGMPWDMGAIKTMQWGRMLMRGSSRSRAI